MVVNDKGVTPMFDFAGTYGTATPATTTPYLLLSVAALFTAALIYRRQLRS